jgi:hypothetical protein
LGGVGWRGPNQRTSLCACVCVCSCVCGRAGISNAVGMAIAQSHLAANFNAPGLEPVVDNYTYVICGRAPCFMPTPLHLVLCMHLRSFSVCVCVCVCVCVWWWWWWWWWWGCVGV